MTGEIAERHIERVLLAAAILQVDTAIYSKPDVLASGAATPEKLVEICRRIPPLLQEFSFLATLYHPLPKRLQKLLLKKTLAFQAFVLFARDQLGIGNAAAE